MHMSRKAVRRTMVGITATSLIAGLTALAVAPIAQAAETRITLPTPEVVYSVANQGNATTTGARVLIGETTNIVTVGGAVVANFGNVTYRAGTTPQGWRGTWYACASRKQSFDACTIVKSQTSQGNVTAANATVSYVVTAGDLGKYLVFGAQVFGREVFRNEDVSQAASTDRNKDIRVVPFGLPTSPRPVIGVNNVVAGGTAGVITGAWTMPSDQTFVSRTVTAWACPDSNAGQGATQAFSVAGCTSVTVTNASAPITTNVTATHALQTTTAMGGKYLVASSVLVARAGDGTPYVYTVRSAATLLPPAPNVGANVTPDATPTPGTTAAPAEPATPPVTEDAVVPFQPTLKIVAKRSVQRGKTLLVTVGLSGKGGGTLGTGIARVELVKSQRANAKAVRVLKDITVEDLSGKRYELIGKKIKKGKYFLRVIFTDSGSGVQAASLKPLRIK